MNKILFTAVITLLGLLPGRAWSVSSDWRTNLSKADAYIHSRQVQKAIPLYQEILDMPGLRDSLRMELCKRLMDAYSIIHNDDQLMHYIYLLKELAERNHNSHFAALAEFTAGQRLHFHGERQKGYDHCLHALEQMKQSHHPHRLIELRAFYRDLLRMYERDKRYYEAIHYSVLQEEAVRDTSDLAVWRDDGSAIREVYALRASLLANAGRMVEADAAYALWLQTTGGNAIADAEILDYLLLSHHDEEALEVIRRCRRLLTSMGDSISYWNLKMIFTKVKVLTGMKQYETVAVYIDSAAQIADSLRIRASHREMGNIYQLLEKQKEMHRRSLIVNWLIALLLLVVLVVGIVFYYNRIIRQRNKTYLKLLNSLDAYRHAAIETPQTEGPDQPAPETELEEDERLFVQMDQQVTRDQLYLQPDLDREKLMHLVGVDKNRFGRMMSKYATNSSVYINTKRAEYGAQLLLNHPEYTIASIAEMCGMRNTVTFNRTFKEVFGVTPSEYRANSGDSQTDRGG